MTHTGHPTRETSERLTDCLGSAHGQISLSIPDGVLPRFLIEAYNATVEGQSDRAVAVLTQQNIDLVDQMAADKRHGGVASLLPLAIVLQRLERQEEALQRYEILTGIEPNPLLFHEQALLHHMRGHYSQALHCRRRALDLMPDNQHISSAYVYDLINAGHLEDGLAIIRQQVEQGTVSADLHSHLLLCSHYLPSLDQAALLQEHVRWARMHAPVHLAAQHHANQLDPNRCLRIGFISHTFCDHAATSQFEALLDGLNRSSINVIGYGSMHPPDEVTERLSAKMDLYRSVHGMEAQAVADLIRQDLIDILVCVTGHTAGHSLGVSAHKPAPVQVDWSCINTTGMSQVDYKLTDQWLNPTGTDQWYVEKLVRLPGGFARLAPHRDVPPVTSLPALSKGFVTFGSFNHHLKINPQVVSLWSDVLKACADSRLLLKFAAGSDKEICRRYRAEFERHGVAADRVRMFGRISPEAHWKLYQRMDIALDTHPYSGFITTLDALWMGVPVVALAGQTYASRMALSILANVGFEKFVATSREQYVSKVMALAANLEALQTLRMTMRQRLLNSPLHDVGAFAREVEEAFREMWRHYCKERLDDEVVCGAATLKSRVEDVTQ